MSADSSLDLSTLDLLPDALLVIGADGLIVHASPLAARLLHQPADQLVGAKAAETIALRDADGNDWWAGVKPLEGDARLLPRIPPRELTLGVGAGRTRPVNAAAARIAAADGSLEVLVLVLRRAEAQLRTDRARSDLVSTVSHELRSPLTSVKGFTKTLLAKWDRFTDEQKRTMLMTVHEDADRVTRLLGELLDVSRIDAGRLQLRRQMVDLQALAARVVQRASIGEEGERVSSAIGSVPSLYADPDKLEQVLTNLVENALKYAEGPVVVSAEVRADDVLVRVADHGPGIAENHLTGIFMKFYRRAGERKAGTGLGLYITKGIVEAHGGRIWAESQPEHGSTFFFTLPQGGLELAGIPAEGMRLPPVR